MSKENQKEIEKILNDNFYLLLDVICHELSNNSNEFIELRQNICDMVEKNKNVNDVCGNNIVKPLSSDDVRDLMQYLELKQEETIIYERQLLLMGMKVTFLLLQKMDLLKTITN